MQTSIIKTKLGEYCVAWNHIEIKKEQMAEWNETLRKWIEYEKVNS